MTNNMQIDIQDLAGNNEAVHPGQSDYFGVSEEDAKILKEVSENLKKSRSKRTSWKQDAREDYDFYSGNQWSEEDAAILREQERPVVVFNRIIRTINAIAGYEVQNRQEPRFFPRNMDISPDGQMPTDVGFSEELSAAVKWVRDETNAEDEESESFIDLLICGEGWTDTVMDYDDNPQGMVKEERIDPLMIDVDPESNKRNYEDAKWVAYTKDLSRKEIREMFPDLDLSDLYNNVTETASDGMLVHNADMAPFYINNYGDKIVEPYTIPVTKYQCVKKEKVTMVLTRDGNVLYLNAKKMNKAGPYIEAMALKTVKMEKNVYRQYIIVGNLVAEKFELGCDHFTIRGITGLRDRNNQNWFGMVRIMKDPQRWANKWLSQIQHIVNSNNKGGAFVEADAPANFREFEELYTQPNSVLKLNPGGLAKIKERTPLQFPGASDKLLQYAIDSIADTSGVSLEMLGMASRNQPIGIEESRKESGTAVLAVFFDALRRYRKIQARVLVYYIREYIADGRLVRVLGRSGIRYVPLIKSRLPIEYDVEVDDAPASPRVKDRTFMACLKLIDYSIQLGTPVPPEVFDYAPIPADLAQKWKQMIIDQSQPTPEQQFNNVAQQQATMQKLVQNEADIEKTNSEIQKNYASAIKDQAVGQEQASLAMEKYGIPGMQQYLAQEEFAAEQQRKDAEILLEHQRKVMEMQMEQARQQMQPQQPQGMGALGQMEMQQ